MKRLLPCVLALLLLVSLPLTVAAADSSLVPVTHAESSLQNAVTNVALIGEKSLSATVKATAKPHSVLVRYEKLTAAKLDTLHTLCTENGVIPGVVIVTEADAVTVTDWCMSKNFYDLNVASEKASALKAVRMEEPLLRTFLFYNTVTDNAQKVRETARSCIATGVILPVKNSTRRLVDSLQQLYVPVWSYSEAVDTVEAARMLSSGAQGVVSNAPQVVFDTISRYYTGVNSVNKTPLVIGHRGNPTQAPENTIEGFLTADKNGATMVELDIYLTKDGEVIILHDPTLKRTTNCRDELADEHVTSLTLEQIRRYRLLNADGSVSDQPVPTLGEVFEALKDGDLNFLIELKNGDIRLMEAMCAVVQKHNMQHRVNVLGASSQSLCALPDTPPFLSGASLGGMVSDRIDLYQNAYTLISGAQNNYSVLNCSLGYTTRELIQIFNDRGIAFHPWGMSASNAFRFYYTFLWGADGLSTDDVQFTKDNPRLFTVDKAGAHTLKSGQTLKVAANVTTYAGQVTNVEKDAQVVWLTDPLDASFDPATGTFRAGNQSGTVSFMLRYTSPLVRVNGLDLLPEELVELENYTLYTQPVTVTVKGSAVATSGSTAEKPTATSTTTTSSASMASQPTTETAGTQNTSVSTEAGVSTTGSTAAGTDGSANTTPHLGLWIALAAVIGAGAIGAVVVLILRKKARA